MVTIIKLVSNRQKTISEIHSPQPMRNLALLVLVQLDLSPPGSFLQSPQQKNLVRNTGESINAAQQWLQLDALQSRKLIFASLSFHIIKQSDCFSERANLCATAMMTFHSISKRLE